MEKALVALLLFASLSTLSFANLYGPATISFEKTWTITGTAGTHLELDGIFIVNNTYQKVESIWLSSGAKLAYGKDGAIKVSYNGTMDGQKKEIIAKAVVDVLYAPELAPDGSFSLGRLPTTGYVKYDEDISAKALELADTGSAYITIGKITDWTNKYMTYDISYFGENVPATQVFQDKRGVCVEYSHLLISLLRSIGFETKYVSGYVYSKEWQPHAWVEVRAGEEWIPLDPTFGEAQYLDDTHLMMYRGTDQGDIEDRITSNKKLDFETSERVEVVSSSKSSKSPAAVSYSFDEGKEMLAVTLINNGGEPVFFAYDIVMPAEAGKGGKKLVFLAPGATEKFVYQINPGYLQPGMIYNIPVIVDINDWETKYDLVVSKAGETPPDTGKSTCPFASFVLAAAAMAAFARR